MKFEILAVEKDYLRFRADHHIITLDCEAMIALMLAIVTHLNKEPWLDKEEGLTNG